MSMKRGQRSLAVLDQMAAQANGIIAERRKRMGWEHATAETLAIAHIARKRLTRWQVATWALVFVAVAGWLL